MTQQLLSNVPVDERDVYAYLRVSTAEQAEEGISLASQLALCERTYQQHYQHRGYPWGGIYSDDGVSTKVPFAERPQGAALLARLRRGSVVICLRSDRMCRSLADAAITLGDLVKRGVALFFVAQGRELNPDDPADQLFYHLMAAVDQFARDQISQRTKEALREKVMRGERIGKTPTYGFTLKGNRLVPCNEERKAMSYIVQQYRTGRTMREIERELRAMGVTRTFKRVFWKYSQLYDVYKKELELREVQRRLLLGELDAVAVPVHYREMCQLPVCRAMASDLVANGVLT
jgi:site-specific DNA recombinase